MNAIGTERLRANGASGRVLEKLGLEFERDVVAANGWPLRLYGLTRERWEP